MCKLGGGTFPKPRSVFIFVYLCSIVIKVFFKFRPRTRGRRKGGEKRIVFLSGVFAVPDRAQVDKPPGRFQIQEPPYTIQPATFILYRHCESETRIVADLACSPPPPTHTPRPNYIHPTHKRVGTQNFVSILIIAAVHESDTPYVPLTVPRGIFADFVP